MALINGLYVFVIDETIDYSLDVTSHPVEKGIDISDHARRQPYVIKLSGEVVGEDAPTKRLQLETMLNKASLITYQGRNIKTNGLIINFSTTHPNNIWGGCSFDMTIQEVRVAGANSYIGNTTPTKRKLTPLKDPQETGLQQASIQKIADKIYKTQKGDSLYEQLVLYEGPSYENLLSMNKNVDPTDVEAGTKVTIEKVEQISSRVTTSGKF